LKKILILIAVLMNFLYFGCSTTKNFDNIICSDCNNQDSVVIATNLLLNKMSHNDINADYELNTKDEGNRFILDYIPKKEKIEDGGYYITVSKKLCQISDFIKFATWSSSFNSSDCYNQDSILKALNVFFSEKNGGNKNQANFEVTIREDEDYFFLDRYPKNHNSRGGGCYLVISKKLCKIVRIYIDQ